MGHARMNCVWRWCARGLPVVLLGLHFSVALAGTWTWTGAGTNDNWSTPDNWTPAGPPGSDNATTLIFGGNNRLMPEEDLCDSFLFGSLTFATNAGSFYLTGTTSAFGKTAWRSLQFSGSNTSLNVLGGADITINGALNTPATVAIQTITVASNRVLQVPWIIGGSHRVVVKKGAGLLRVYESDDGQRYLQNSCNVGPEYCIDEGTVEMGTRTDRYVLASDGSGWKADPVEVKASYTLAVGDGIGEATSAVFRLIGPLQTQLLDNNLVITVNSDGLLDLNGVQDWCRNSDDPLHLAISNGLVRLGSSSLFVRNGRTLEMRGNARIEGDGDSAIRFYDGATNRIDGLTTCAVLVANAALVRADNAAGVVFQVSGPTGDVAALAIAGHLGAGGSGSHLVKRGVGTLALGDLTHALRTNRVEEGTLLLNGLSRCGSSVSGAQWVVASQGTLGGAGIISNAAVVVQGGTLDPGDVRAGILTIESDLVLTANATLAFDLTRADAVSGRVCDQLVIQKGALRGLTNAALRIELHDHVNVDGQTFRIISGGGDLTGQMFRTVALTGRAGRRAEVITGNGYVDIAIRNTLAGTGVLIQ